MACLPVFILKRARSESVCHGWLTLGLADAALGNPVVLSWSHSIFSCRRCWFIRIDHWLRMVMLLSQLTLIVLVRYKSCSVLGRMGGAAESAWFRWQAKALSSASWELNGSEGTPFATILISKAQRLVYHLVSMMRNLNLLLWVALLLLCC